MTRESGKVYPAFCIFTSWHRATALIDHHTKQKGTPNHGKPSTKHHEHGTKHTTLYTYAPVPVMRAALSLLRSRPLGSDQKKCVRKIYTPLKAGDKACYHVARLVNYRYDDDEYKLYARCIDRGASGHVRTEQAP